MPARTMALAVAAALAAPVAALPSPAGPGAVLASGQVAAGSPARHAIPVTAGELVRLRFERAGGDVAVTVAEAEGEVLEADTLAFPAGELAITFLPRREGALAVALRPVAGGPAASYVITVAERRPAAAGDAQRIAAERAYLSGERARVAGTAEALARARTALTQALDLYRSLADPVGEGNALSGLGRVADGLNDKELALRLYGQALAIHRAQGRDRAVGYTLNFACLVHDLLGQRERAMEALEEAAAAAQRAGDVRLEGVTLNNVGLVQLNLGNRSDALFFYEEALALHRKAGNVRTEVNTLAGIGLLQEAMGDRGRALSVLGDALKLAEAVGDPREVATAANNLGSVHFNRDEIGEAIAAYERALAAWRQAGNSSGEAATLHNLAHASEVWGDPQRAIELYTQAIAVQKETRSPVRAANSMTNLGRLYWRLGDNAQALRLMEEALAAHRSAGNPSFEAAALSTLGGIQAARGDHAQARAFYEEALAVRRRMKDAWGEAHSLRDLGRAAEQRGDVDGAGDTLMAALGLFQEIGSPRAEAGTLIQIASLRLREGAVEEAAEAGLVALDFQRQAGDARGTAAALYTLARVDVARGALGSARDRLQEAIAGLDLLRSRLASHDLRATFTASVQDYYDLLIDVLMRLHRERSQEGHDLRAFEAAQRARGRSLLEVLFEARAGIRAGLDPALRQRERRLQQALNAKAARQSRLLAGRTGEAAARRVAAEIDHLAGEYRELQAEIRRRSPRYAELVAPEPVRAADVQKDLVDDGTVLLQYALGRERSYLWMLTPSALEGHELPPRAVIEGRARAVAERLRRQDGQGGAESDELARMLLAPVAGRIAGRRLLFVMDGALQAVPPAALPAVDADGRPRPWPLVRDHEVVVLPSVSALAVLRADAASRPRPPRRVAVIADPVFDADDPRVQPAPARLLAGAGPGAPSRSWRPGSGQLGRLIGARREAAAIAAAAPGAGTLQALDFKASRATATGGGLARYRVVHFATHGLLDDVHPELSGIVLSLVDEQGRPQDGFLRLHEVYNLHLPADLVVLSACQTALGQEVRGEGLVGLTRGFLYAGASRVMATLWKVDDSATAELMKRFYAALFGRGASPAAALRAAQASMAAEARWRAPYNWAGFTLQGEWR